MGEESTTHQTDCKEAYEYTSILNTYEYQYLFQKMQDSTLV